MMRYTAVCAAVTVGAMLGVGLAAPAASDDWVQFRGPGARGVVVMDACLDESTTRRLEDFVRDGGKLLVFTTPARVGGSARPCGSRTDPAVPGHR